ncbi:MAG: ferrous iron transport protein B [Bacteroidales bacterium]|nr:ferrous iron transport protein B [Bacteroidales bacterium]
MKLSELKNNEFGVITKVLGRGAFKKRIGEMGFVRGKKVTVIKNAPLKDPIQYQIMGYEVSLRRSEASQIQILTKDEILSVEPSHFNGVITEDILKKSAHKKQNIINIALVGNPNSGKTSFFNHASRSRERVGNYGGVTVESKSAEFKYKNYTINIVDLPGTYSLSAYSPEELYVRRYITSEMPDIVVNVIDSSNLERNLYLTTQLIDMDVKVIIALNMYDELLEKGDVLDYDALGKMLGTPITPTISSKGEGINKLLAKVVDVYEDKDETVRHIHINYGKDVEKSIRTLQDLIWINKALTDKISSRFCAIKMLEKDKAVSFQLSQFENYEAIKQTASDEIRRLEKLYNEDTETYITNTRYGFVSGALKETYTEGIHSQRKKTEIIDTFLTHKLLSYPIFIFLMWVMFEATFKLGKYPMELIDNGVLFLRDAFNNWLPESIFKDLLIDGILGGVGGVIVFLPNILILYFFISIMEDTGYMARTAFIMDKLMHKIGLHGKSFIPLLMGFGCNVPAIMATRTIENRNNRILTMLITPFMSCSARLPVYILLIGAFFQNNQGTILFSIYAIGIVVGILSAIFLNKFFFKSSEAPFVMELPPYRVPTVKAIFKHMWFKASLYLKKVGGIILVASVIIWFLGYFPVNTELKNGYDRTITQFEQSMDKMIASTSPENVSLTEKLIQIKDENIHSASLSEAADIQQNTYIGSIGHFIEPAIRPLGFDWKMGISLITGIAAKEIVVSTMSIVYQSENPGEITSASIYEKLQNEKFEWGNKKGQYVLTPLTAYAFLVFILLYFPCMGVIATIRKEAGSWKWALFTVFYTTAAAWIISFAIFQIGSLFIS